MFTQQRDVHLLKISGPTLEAPASASAFRISSRSAAEVPEDISIQAPRYYSLKYSKKWFAVAEKL